MNVHAGTVVANDGFWHEGRGLAVGVGDVVDHVLLQLDPVSALDQRAEFGAEFHLAGIGDFVVMHFDRNAEGFEHQAHFGAHVLEAVDGWHREITTLDGWAMAAVAVLVFLAGVPGGFFRADLDEAAGHVGLPADAVENEEFRLWTEVGGVAQAGGLHVGFSALGQRTRIALIGFAVGRVDDVAGQDHRRFFKKRIDVGGVGVGHELHVRGFNALPAGDGRAVKRVAGNEFIFIEMGNRHGDVLLFAPCVGKTEVNKLDFVFLDHFYDVCDGLCHQILLLRMVVKKIFSGPVNALFVPQPGA